MQPNKPTEKEADPQKIIATVLRVLNRGRILIPVCGLLTLVVAVVGLKYVPNRFKSEATILIDEQQISQRLVTPLSSESVAERVQEIAQEILSRARLMDIVKEYGLFDYAKGSSPNADYSEVMRKAIEIKPAGEVARDGSFQSFTISFTAPSGELAQAVTQKLCLLFIEKNAAGQVERANATTNFFKEPLEEKRKRAAQIQQQIAGFKMQHSTDLTDGRTMNDSRVTEARIQLQNVQSNLAHAKEQQILYETLLSGNLGRLKNERAALLLRFTPKHPTVVKKDEEIAQLETLLNNLNGAANLHLSLSDPTISQLAGQIAANGSSIQTLSKDEQSLKMTIAELQSHLAMVPVRDQQLAELMRQADTLNDEISNLEKLEQQSNLSADMERNQQGRQFRLLDAANLPLEPFFPKKLPISAGGMAAGLALGFVICFLRDLKVAAYYDEQDLREDIMPPMVLSIPSLPTAAEKRSARLRTGMELVAGGVFGIAMLALEFWVFKHA